MKRLITAITLLVVGLVIACGGNGGDSTDQGSGPSSGPGSAVGPGISVEDAISSDSTGPLLINGFLVIQGGEHDSPEVVRLCDALAESFPPQCGGASLIVVGLDQKAVEGLTSEGPVTWSDHSVQLLGTVDGDTLTVTEAAR